MSHDFEIGISLAAFSSTEAIRIFRAEAQSRSGGGGRGADWQPPAPVFELSYTTSSAMLRQLGFLRGGIVSVHAPCPAAETFPNLGSRDRAVVDESLETIGRSAATAAAHGADLVVLHPGYTTDSAVFSDSTRRLAALSAFEDSPESSWLWLREGTICKPGYCASPLYRMHLETAMDNLSRAAARCAAEGVRLAVENLNPRLTYLFQLPQELVELSARIPQIVLCVDLGHLWIASLVHGFDFRDGLRAVLDTGRVVTTHVHDNSSTLGPPPSLADDHGVIGSGHVPISEALPLLAAAGVRRLIIESVSSPLESYSRLLALVRRQAAPG